jgi:hypothetical protein
MSRQRSNPNAQITMTGREKWKLESKAKQGWKCFFIQRDFVDALTEHRLNNRITYQQIQNNNNIDIEFLRKAYLELYEKVGDLTDCPVCFETMVKDNTHLGICGHMVCKTCKENLNDCPICRRGNF